MPEELQLPPTLRVSGLQNDGKGVNPKDKIGAKKVSMSLIPSTALIELALAQMDGAGKYGPYNWRAEPVQALTYIDGAKRHLTDWLEGQEIAEDSGAHHLGHVMACCAILIDAQRCGMLTDNRPILGRGSRDIDEANRHLARSAGAQPARGENDPA